MHLNQAFQKSENSSCHVFLSSCAFRLYNVHVPSNWCATQSILYLIYENFVRNTNTRKSTGFLKRGRRQIGKHRRWKTNCSYISVGISKECLRHGWITAIDLVVEPSDGEITIAVQTKFQEWYRTKSRSYVFKEDIWNGDEL